MKSQSKNKQPNYIPIYNDLYENIVSGKLTNGSTIPSEHELSQTYAVSRNTVRQALTILREDGLIVKHQGRSSIVSSRRGLNEAARKRIFNPITNGSLITIDEILIDYNYDLPTKVAMDRLEINQHNIVLASNNIYKSENKPIAHTFVQIPSNIMGDFDLDLNDEEALTLFMSEKIYTHAKYSESKVKVINAHENIASFLEVEEGAVIIYIEMTLWNEKQEGIGRIKYYLISEFFELNYVIQ